MGKEEQELSKLIRNRGSIKQKLTILERFLESVKVSSPDSLPSLNDLELRLRNSLDLLSEFDAVQSIIESLCQEGELPEHYNERETFENRYYRAQDSLTQYVATQQASLPPLRVDPSATSSNDLASNNLQNILLPKIKLPTFSGNFDQWLHFKLSFTSIISTNSGLSESQKFQFLKASLEGYAVRFVEGLDGMDKPFTKAWELLCGKFDKKHFLVDVHFQQLLSISSVDKDNFAQVTHLLDNLTKHLNALTALKLTHETLFDSLIIHLMSIKLDKATMREWKEVQYEADLPTLNEFLEFLKGKADLLQSIEQSYESASYSNGQGNKHKPQKQHSQNKYQLNLVNNVESSNTKCNFCQKNHTIYQCSDFLSLTTQDRFAKVKQLRLCLNCLRPGHQSDKCTLGSCKTCKQFNKTFKHNTLLHFDKDNSERQFQTNETVNNVNMLARPSVDNFQQVLLSTVMCQVQDYAGNLISCRALLDSGAQSNMITERFCNKLRLKCFDANLSIVGVNQVVSPIKKKCNLTIFSNNSNFSCTIACLVTPIITSNIPLNSFKVRKINIPSSISLADPNFDVSQEIDLLLGASLFWDLLVEGKIQLDINLSLQNTQFGYIVTGCVPVDLNNSVLCNLIKTHIPEDDQLKKFWELEEVECSSSTFLSKEQLQCEELFKNDTFRNKEGQFVVKFPLKHSPELLGDSKTTAMKRFLSLEKKFNNLPFKNLYFEFIHEYIELGHMTKISDVSESSITPSYILPHHGVLRENSTTTKLRTVFDGSCPTSSGWSLNELQFVGPKLQNNIVNILLRFRLHLYVVSADISKMYRCILMNPEHRPLQRILWRENPDEDISLFQLNTVSYGTTSAPYLAIKCLQQLAIDNSNQFPAACNTILHDFYVDDLLSGSNDLAELNTRCHQISSILKSAHFVLRKWVSNEPNVISGLYESHISNSVLNIGKNESCKTLGIQWITNSDCLKYTIAQPAITHNNRVSKRIILSTIAQIYDPLGLLSPFIITSKILIQKLWRLRLDWDTEVPSEFKSSFLKFQQSLSNFSNLSIPRCVIPKSFELVDVHCFCDASKDAYATAIYLRSKNIHGQFCTYLLCSKTKVAPLKTITIPKLELCASLLGAQLLNEVRSSFAINVPVCLWSDSKVALSWIQTEPSVLQVFVANRVAKIQSLTNPSDWRYVNSKLNPADLASRGVKVEDLSCSSIWWLGPQFLKQDKSCWPSLDYSIPKNELPEIKKKAIIMTSTYQEPFYLFTKFSNYIKLLRITVLCIRFFKNLYNKKLQGNKSTGPITVVELDYAKMVLVKLSQHECFLEELQILSKTTCLNKKHSLSSLVPFIDDFGVLRVGGRLRNTSLPYDTKHPVLLSSKHPFTKLIFEYKHKVLLHPGPQLLLSSVRQFYWPIGGRNLAKKTVRSCLTCFKFNPVPYTSPMSNLPENRIKFSLPFETTGVDYAGPFQVLNKPGRGAKLYKCYLVIFVCFSTKAVHLEVVTNLTTEHFLLCLKRFTSRRGIPHDLYSDNGSTFIGARNELKELGRFILKNHGYFVDVTSHDNINWHFIPPYTPNFGGLWESAVKSAKHHLKRVMLNHNVTLEEFITITTQVEGILNSRPLYAMSNDPNDNSPITPSHFLIGRPITQVPELILENTKFNRLSRVQHMQKLCQQFWRQFSKHYIAQLHHQYKWKTPSCNLQEGTVVLLRNDKLPPYKWQLGKIAALHPGRDGNVRIATVTTSAGTITRSVRHLCPLPRQPDLLTRDEDFTTLK